MSKIKIQILLSVIIVLALSVAVTAGGFIEDSNWLMFRHDQPHSGTSLLGGLSKLSILWNTSAKGPVWSSPAYDQNVVFDAGTTDAIFIGSDAGGEFYAINAIAGTKVWTFVPQTLAKIRTSPAILKDITIYTPPPVSPIPHQDVIYFGTDAAEFFAVNEKTGQQVWKYSTPVTQPPKILPVRSSPIVDKNVSFTRFNNNTIPPINFSGVFFGTDEGYFHALEAHKGFMLWIYTAKNRIRSSPALDKKADILFNLSSGGDGPGGDDAGPSQDINGSYFANLTNASVLFFGSDDGVVYALGEINGVKTWKYLTGGKVRSSPLASKGNVYTYVNLSGKLDTINGTLIVVGSDDKNIYAISERDGLRVWNFPTDGVVRSSAAEAIIDGNKSIIIGSDDGKIYALRASDGASKWTTTLEGKIRGSASVSYDGRAAITSCNGYLYTLNATNGIILQKHRLNYTGDCDDNDDFFSSPTLGSGRTLFLGSPDGRILAFQNKAPDLLVSKISTSKSAANVSEPVNISITVNNTGDASAQQTELNLYLTDQSNPLRNFTVPSLAAATSSVYSWIHNFTATGNYNICALADSKNNIDESDESNNEKCISFSVGTVPTTTTVTTIGPDTRKPEVSNLIINPESPKEGQSVTISGTAADNAALTSVALQFQDGEKWIEKGSQKLSGTTGSFNFTLITTGAVGAKITWRVVVSDAAGNSYESEPKSFIIAQSECVGSMPQSFNKTSCTAGTLTHVDYACNDVTKNWEPKESQIPCTMPFLGIPFFGEKPVTGDSLLWIGLIILLLLIAGGIYYYFMKIKKQSPPSEPPPEPGEEPPPEPPPENPPESQPPEEGEGYQQY